jgi:predicted porin
MKMYKKLLTVAGCLLISTSLMRADDVSDLKAQMQVLQQKLNEMQQQLQKVTQQQQPSNGAKTESADQPAPGSQKPSTDSAQPDQGNASLYTGNRTSQTTRFFERKPGKDLTFYTGGDGSGSESGPGQLTMYGSFDISFDLATKGLKNEFGPDGMPPVGNMGWLPDISTNNTYIGVRGFQPVSTMPFNVVYQFETSIDIASTSGIGETNSSESNAVKGALTSRNTFIGISSPVWGSIKFGKTFAPYMASTIRMDPFYGVVGDYQAIMGNTGGDNRVEFGTRLDHSIWYESPNWGGVNLNVLFSPGQNRAINSDNLAAGESDCTGGNIPGSGGINPITCSDGSFSNAVSANISYSKGPLFLVAAYERHMKVNRESDITGLYATCGATCTTLELQDVADEDAGKVAAQYKLTRGTAISGIFETMHRYIPADLEFQNERQRMGSWLSLDQRVTKNTTLSFGWAHAFRTPGDPGQHNDSNNTPPDGIVGTDAVGGAHENNQASLFSAALRYKASNSLGFYLAWGFTANGPFAHYDLGAGSRSVQTDCHDASDAAGGLVGSDPHCWTGGQLQGASVGMNWKF